MSITHLGQELHRIVRRAVVADKGSTTVDPAATLADVVESLPTLGTGQACNLKVDRMGFRVWLSRCGLADGEPFENTIYLEEYDDEDGRWNDIGYFDGDVPFADLMG